MKIKAIKLQATRFIDGRIRENLECALSNSSTKRPLKDSRLMQGQRKIAFAFGENTSAIVAENGAIDVATGEFYLQYADITEVKTGSEPHLYTAKTNKTLYKAAFIDGHHYDKPLTAGEQQTVIRAAVRFFTENTVRFNYPDESEINAAFCPTDEDKKQLIDLITESALNLVEYPNFNGTYADIEAMQNRLNLDTYDTIVKFSPDYKQNECFKNAYALLEKESRADAMELEDTLNESWLEVCRYAFEFYIHKYLHIAGRNDCIRYLLRYWADEMGVADMHENKAWVIAAETADLNKNMWKSMKEDPSLETLDEHFDKYFQENING